MLSFQARAGETLIILHFDMNRLVVGVDKVVWFTIMMPMLAADQLGVKGGAEFIAARLESEKLGSQLVLGDRPIEITLERAWEAMSWKRKLQLCCELLMASLTQRSDREARLWAPLTEHSVLRDRSTSDH
jgi:pheromone shutdown protein TraB